MRYCNGSAELSAAREGAIGVPCIEPFIVHEEGVPHCVDDKNGWRIRLGSRS